MAVNGDFEPMQFMSKVENLGGVARKDRFSVEITPPQSLNSTVQAGAINFLAKAVSLPARSFGSTTYRSGGRFALSVPYETTYEPVTISMLNTNDHAPRRFWSEWFDHIQGTHGQSGSYNMQYYKNFIGSVKISYYNEMVNEMGIAPDYEVILHNAWPSTLSAIELGWENSDLSEFDIDITYSRWESKSSGQRTFLDSGSGFQ